MRIIKKPVFWIIAAAVAVCAVAAVVLLSRSEADTDDGTPAKPLSEAEASASDPLDTAVSKAILEHCGDSDHYADAVSCESHYTYAVVTEGDTINVYCDMFCLDFQQEDGKLVQRTGGHFPVALTFDGSYNLLEFWVPQDGTYYEPSIREKFPSDAADEAMDNQTHALSLTQQCYAKGVEHFNLDTDAAIESILDEIMSSPQESSSPADYIAEHPIEYRELTFYGDYTLSYVLREFLAGGQTGLKGQLMRELLDELAPESAMRLHTETGQEYFDVWRDEAEKLKAENGLDFMKEHAHAMYMLMQLEAQ